MLNSVPYLAALIFSAFCIPLSADADTPIPAAIESWGPADVAALNKGRSQVAGI
jgi:hypothetical protein